MPNILENRKLTFFVFCVMMFGVNVLGYGVPQPPIFEDFMIQGLRRSIISIPVWSLIGLVLSQIVILIRKKLRPEIIKNFNIWQKMTLGLLVGMFANAFFKIPW